MSVMETVAVYYLLWEGFVTVLYPLYGKRNDSGGGHRRPYLRYPIMMEGTLIW